MIRHFFIISSQLVLAGCSSPPSRPLTPLAPTTNSFVVSARFAIRQESPEGTPRSLAGRLNWTHRPNSDHLLLSDPLANGVAELRQDAAGAHLKLADGKEVSAADASTLLQRTLGYTLPIKELAIWLTGRKATQRDQYGRAASLSEGEWKIDYAYENNDADAPPARITVQYTGSGELKGLELRLRIEDWNQTP